MTGRTDVSGAVDVLAGLPTAVVSYALDRLGLPGSVHGIAPLRDGQRPGIPATHFVTLDQPTTIELAAVWHRDENVLVDAFLASARHAC